MQLYIFSMGSGSGSDLHRRKAKRRHSLFFLSFQRKEFHYHVTKKL